MKKRMLAIIASTIAMAILSSTAVFADTEGITETSVEAQEQEVKYTPGHWGQVGSKWFFYQEDGTAMKNTWVTSLGGTYWVNNDGSMAVNQWFCADDAWYRADGDGFVLRSQLFKENSDLYWLNEDGKMAVESWKQDGEGKWYYFQNNGKAFKNGWQMIAGDYYYFLKNGVLAQDALVPGGGRVDASGKWIQN